MFINPHQSIVCIFANIIDKGWIENDKSTIGETVTEEIMSRGTSI